MKNRVITGTLTAYLSEYSASIIGPKELSGMDGQTLSNALTFSSNDMTSMGWTKVGVAQVSVELNPTDEILASAVAALRAEQEKTLADAQNKATAIEKKIQSLLAISFDEVEA